MPVGGWPASLPGALLRHGLAAISEPGLLAGAWEPEPWRRTLQSIEARGLGGAPTRVVLSTEGCALRLSPASTLVREVSAWRAAGFAVSLALPVAYEAVWAELVGAVEALVAADVGLGELVINDLGLLSYAAARWDLPLGAGRLLWRAKRDVFAADPAVLPATDGLSSELALANDGRALGALRGVQQDAHSRPYLDEPEWLAELLRLRVRRVSLEVLPTPLSRRPSGPLGHSLHLPWTFLGATRICPLAAALEGGPTTHPTTACRRSCRTHAVLHTYPWRHPIIVQRGAALFMDCSESLDTFLDSTGPACDRYVLQPWLPW